MASIDTTLLVSAGTVLAGAVGYLFKELLRVKDDMTAQSEKLGEYRGRQEGIIRLSSEVLDTVHKAAMLPPEDLRDVLGQPPVPPRDLERRE